MADTSQREPTVDEARHPFPVQTVLLTTTLQNPPPQSANFLTEGRDRGPILRDAIVTNISPDH